MKVLKMIVDEMPEGCSKCGLMGAWFYTIRDKYFRPEYHLTRPDWCPLEVETDGWIAVSERLPEDDTLVCVFCNGQVSYGKHYKNSVKWILEGQYEFGEWSGAYHTVTHWRPLPEAPKEVKGE